MLRRRRFRRRWAGLLLLALVSLSAIGTLTGCGGGFSYTAGKAYTITITATSGATVQTTTVQLTVQ
jgi:hypothetical protein